MAIAIYTSFGQQSDSNGVPITGSVQVYAAGTTTPLSLFSDTALSVSADNPVNLSAGRHDMRYIATAAYKIVVYTGANGTGSVLYTRDNIDPGVAVGSGALPVANGGTAGTTAAAARTNLAAASSTDMATAQSDIADLQTWSGFELTTRSRIASGTTAQEPAAGTVGLRFNSTTGYLRLDNGSAWKSIPYAGQLLPADFATGEAIICTQRSRSTSTATTAITAVIAQDTSIPQISEGTEIFSVSFTPKSATSTLRFRLNLFGTNSGTIGVTAALFKGSTLDAVAAKGLSGGSTINEMIFEHEETSALASAATWSVRVGVTSGTFTLNGGSSPTLGGLQKTIFVIEVWLSP